MGRAIQIKYALLISAICFCLHCYPQKEPLFSVVIDEFSMTFHQLVYVNSDSLKVQSYSHKNGRMTHRQKITDEQRLKLLSLLMETNWQKIEKRQVKDNAPDDYPDFDFTIQIHNRLFKYNVYLTRVDQLLELANYLNSILPKQFSIDYTDEYIGYVK